MPAAPGLSSQHATTGRPHARGPSTAERLRLPLHQRSQQRMQERWGFDVNSGDACERAEALLAESPADPDALLVVATVRSSRGDDEGALAAARRAVEIDGVSARAHSTLAALLARAGDTEQALAEAMRAVELDPADPAALYNLGLARWSGGDHRAARADLDRAAELLGLPRPAWWRPGRR